MFVKEPQFGATQLQRASHFARTEVGGGQYASPRIPAPASAWQKPVCSIHRPPPLPSPLGALVLEATAPEQAPYFLPQRGRAHVPKKHICTFHLVLAVRARDGRERDGIRDGGERPRRRGAPAPTPVGCATLFPAINFAHVLAPARGSTIRTIRRPARTGIPAKDHGRAGIMGAGGSGGDVQIEIDSRLFFVVQQCASCLVPYTHTHYIHAPQVIVDMYVKPPSPVTDYKTQYSGITVSDLKNVQNTLKDAQNA